MDRRRRNTLRIVGAVLAAGLAGCGGDDGEPTTTADPATDTLSETDPGSDSTDTGTATVEGTATPTGTATQTATATETARSETATATGTATATETELSGVGVAINNVGFSAWEVVEDESGAVAPTGEENPTMTLEVGTRYVIENGGWSVHPFALRGADDSPLLSQDADGAYEDDTEVDWVDNGETLAFTVTDALAADLDYYICTVHSSMRGDVETA